MATSFIARTRESIRELAGEPGVNAKYSDTRLLTWIEKAYAHVLSEFNRRAANPLLCRYDLTISGDAEVYQLPPTIQRVIDVRWLDSQGRTQGHMNPRAWWHPAGPNFLFEGSTLRLDPPIRDGSSYDLRIVYLPSGTVRLHTGTAGTITNSVSDNQCTIVLDDSPAVGTLDTRPHAYAGSVLRILSATENDYVQDRIIQAYDVTTKTATVVPHFDADLVPGGIVTYEIAPPFDETIDLLVATYVARTIVALEGDRNKFELLTEMWREQLRDLSQQVSYYSALHEGKGGATRFAHGRYVQSYWSHLGR